MRFLRRKRPEPSFAPHDKYDCDLGGCDICLSYWELLALMLEEQRRSAPSLPVAADPKETP